MTREYVVDALIDAANTAMVATSQEHKATAAEALSAYVTMARNAIVIARNNGADQMILRVAIQQILMELPERGRVM